MNHYQVLGVEPDADTASIRSAYLRLARVNHPDFSESSGEQMRLINAAWHELSDPERRMNYDLSLRSGYGHGISDIPNGATFSASTQSSRKTSRISRPSTEFTPLFQSDEDDDDSWRYQPDIGDPATVPSKVLLAAPATAFVAGIALIAVSFPTGIRALTAVGMILLVLSGFLFVGAPVVAMFKSQLVEQRGSRARTRRHRRGSR